METERVHIVLTWKESVNRWEFKDMKNNFMTEEPDCGWVKRWFPNADKSKPNAYYSHVFEKDESSPTVDYIKKFIK